MNWTWIPLHLAIGWHARLIEMFGGAPGLRDYSLLESALVRPRNLHAYQPEATLYQLAAVYGVSIAKAHAFTDGNKRLAFAVMITFLKAHGQELDAPEAEATAIMLKVASGKADERVLEQWLAAHCRV